MRVCGGGIYPYPDIGFQITKYLCPLYSTSSRTQNQAHKTLQCPTLWSKHRTPGVCDEHGHNKLPDTFALCWLILFGIKEFITRHTHHSCPDVLPTNPLQLFCGGFISFPPSLSTPSSFLSLSLTPCYSSLLPICHRYFLPPFYLLPPPLLSLSLPSSYLCPSRLCTSLLPPAFLPAYNSLYLNHKKNASSFDCATGGQFCMHCKAAIGLMRIGFRDSDYLDKKNRRNLVILEKKTYWNTTDVEKC